jgi:hypothetical protein
MRRVPLDKGILVEVKLGKEVPRTDSGQTRQGLYNFRLDNYGIKIMEDKDNKISLGFAEEKVPAGSHICYIFNDESERHKIMAKYLQSGLLAGEKVLYVFDTISKEELKATLEELGVDLSVPRQIDLKDVRTIYYPHGSFSSSIM